MNTKHKPATALPWKSEEIRYMPGKGNYTAWTIQAGINGCVAEIKYTGKHPKNEISGDEQNASYICHASNAYPELVEALRHALAAAALLNETAKSPGVEQRFQKGLALLQKLGEA